MGPVRIGVLGCAAFARRRVLPAVAASSGAAAGGHAEVVAVASRSIDKAREFAADFGGKAVPGYAELLDLPEVEAVYVPLPPALHAPWVRAALLAGKHVLVEKPMSTDAATTAELLDLARARGLVLQENVLFVHHHQHTVVRRLLRQGAIGEVTELRSRFTVPELPADDIRYRPDLGGGALLDIGLYPVRSALHLLGGPFEVVEAELTRRPGDAVETGGRALLRTAAGVRAELAFGLVHDYRSCYELVGTGGRLVVDRAFTPPADHRPELVLERDGRRETLRLDCDDQVGNAISAFATAVRRGARPDADALNQALLLDRIREFSGEPESL
uniref:PyrC9 n=1 Tax=Streptomyces rugosporus TaxID=295838 RepID=K7QVV2_STRRG|nr:PyrC9 [Streptomyces rugosporus]